MNFNEKRGSRVFGLLSLILVAVFSATLEAEKLPLKVYTTTDGLPHNTVMRIVRDSQGFLWFCTLGGLSRFDGYAFANYGPEEGLRGQVTDLLETRQGEYWVATLSGLYRFNPKPSGQNAGEKSRSPDPSTHGQKFELFRLTDDTNTPGVNALREDRRGTIWVATNAGLYRLARFGSGWTARLTDIAVPGKTGNKARVLELFVDDEGAIWASLPDNGLRRILSDDQVESYTTLGRRVEASAESAFGGTVNSIAEDHTGRIWLATDQGLSLLTRKSSSASFELRRTYKERDGLRDDAVEAVFETADGNIWAGTSSGLSELCTGSGCGNRSFRSYLGESLERFGAWSLVDDREGNLWIANQVGALRLARDGFTTYGEVDGLGSSRVYWVGEDRSNRIYAVTQGERRGDLNVFDGFRFHRVLPRLPKRRIAPFEVRRQNGFQDRTGDWWIASEYGLLRYANVEELTALGNVEPTAVYSRRMGSSAEDIAGLYADSHGDLWIGSLFLSTPTGALSRWQRSTQSIRVYGTADGLTAPTAPISFCEDHSGNLWIGFLGQGLARYRAGRFTVFAAVDGLPPGAVWSIYLDHANRIWVATTEGGAARIDEPAQDHPKFKTYTTSEGLSSNQIQAITEDQWGRIYLLTNKGVDRLDPQTGWIKHFTSADGLVNSSHWGVAFRDHGGGLWFATLQGISRLIPKQDEPASPPAIRVTAIRIRGESYPISELGETRVAHLVLEPNQNNVQIDFGSLNFGTGEVLRYQYKLEGAEQSWSRFAEQRTVNYATLSPGRYRFLVRAVNWKGLVSPEAAEVDFQVLAPVWQRWWFQSLLLLLIAGATYGFYRFRLKRLLELERVRTRIATDLHDDIGSNLTQISILSEVVRQKVGEDGQSVAEPLIRIAELSRELVDSMSDIVWAVNPRRDHIGDLAHRMRRFASDVLSARNVEFDFHASEANQDRELRTDKRRQVFLVFKEGINNIVRHSECKHVRVELGVEHGHLLLKMRDDGKGFDPARLNGNENHQGHGLQSMAERAKNLGGELQVDSHPGQGTDLILRVPL